MKADKVVVRGVEKRFARKQDELVALSAVDLSVAEGELVC
jgi:ABC-type nitrate/sulfonate/bicarbonate transport system ATPase subunit